MRQRALLEQFSPYVPGEQPASRDVVKLNTNENPYPPVDGVIRALKEMDGERLRRYPDPACQGLVSRLGLVYDFPPEGVLVGNGSDEILSMAARAFLDPGDRAVLTDPTYSLYHNIVLLQDAVPVAVPLGPCFEFPEQLLDAEGKILFLASPNSPNGASFSPSDVADLAGSFDGLVLVDEAYADFAETNCLDLARERDNVIVVRTFSKAFSLASLRIGFALGRPDTIRSLRLVKDSYNVNAAAQVAGCAALDEIEEVRERVRAIRRERERVMERVGKQGFEVFPSDANFFLFRTPRAREYYEGLKEDGIYVRYFDRPGLDDCLRATIGTPEQNDAFLAALDRLGKEFSHG